MSEYQYHEWQTVDRVLTSEEQAAVNRLSSHIDVSSSQAVVTYNWGDFKHDPKQVLLEYFDAYFYMANWGSLRLMFRFPKGLLDEADIEPYCVYDYITFETSGAYQVLELDFSPEDGGGWMEAEAGLSHFIRLRADLLEGDYRLLYLAWLKAMVFDNPYDDDEDFDDEEYDDEEDTSESQADDLEPPVPPGLKKLSPALQNFVQVFEIDPFLIQAVAEASPDPKKALAIDYRDLVARLPRAECDDFLVRLAQGDTGVGLSLRKRLGSFLPQERPKTAKPRSFQQLLQRAERLEKAEQKRQAEEARQKHIAEMKALAGREAQTWQQVENLLDNGRKIASVYDEATALLEKLKQLSEFQDTRDIFRTRLRRLAEKYTSRPSLIERWRKKGWV
jgi:hypothetical protein